MNRAMSRLLTLTLAAGFAVVGSAGAASAWDNTISGTVACATGGGWAVTWQVVNSESETETITESDRPTAVPVGTMLDASETRTFTETITTKPTADLTLTLTAEWDTGDTSTDSGSVSVALFSDDCAVKTIAPPTVPVVDDCGPGNAHYGTVPSGPWTATTNPDGSLTLTAAPGNVFPNGQTSITLPAPVDSMVPCPVVAPPPVAPPVVTPPEVLPAEVRVVTAKARHIDKCGRASDMYKVARRAGVVYRAGGTVLREGRWLKATHRTVTVRATAADATFRLSGKSVWKMRFTNKPCAKAPEIAPDTGA
jgi:hypothetical protein